MISRRSFLRGLCALPLAGLLLPKEVPSAPPVEEFWTDGERCWPKEQDEFSPHLGYRTLTAGESLKPGELVMLDDTGRAFRAHLRGDEVWGVCAHVEGGTVIAQMLPGPGWALRESL